MRTFVACILLSLTAVLAAPAAETDRHEVLFHENFTSLDNWKPFFFPGISSHSTYTIERDGNNHVLCAASHASASAIVYKRTFNVTDYPRARWRWKVSNVYSKANPHSRSGDDYPIQVNIMFEYDPRHAGLGKRIEYGLAKTLYGEYPPDCSLDYVWSSRMDGKTFMASPYSSRAVMVLLEKGPSKVGHWVDENVDILDDFRKAFHRDPPARARIAVMNDSDNTGERSRSWMEYIEVFR